MSEISKSLIQLLTAKLELHQENPFLNSSSSVLTARRCQLPSKFIYKAKSSLPLSSPATCCPSENARFGHSH